MRKCGSQRKRAPDCEARLLNPDSTLGLEHVPQAQLQHAGPIHV
jgi:hypothetical protein